ncbi:DUF2577 family protein [Priestia abyssalis]|uniref:DUF2577 family protein n=1 Tax=Priestia abyssalis TaxID=1221450 RepID=UPI000995021C|nr:DUF2577 family protein [Priestia abyssalis]
MSDSITELALLFKERDNPGIPSVTTGIVLSPLPDIIVKLNDFITLYKNNIIVAEHIYSHYEHQNPLRWLNIGDEVIIIPTVDEQLYFMLDKARRMV